MGKIHRTENGHFGSGIPLFEKLMNIFKSQAITEDFQIGNSSR